MKLLMLLYLSSCALYKQEASVPERIKELQIAGKWKNEKGHFIIGCKGEFEYKEPVAWDNRTPKHSEVDGTIRWIRGYQFKTGPIFGETHDINRTPYEKNGKWLVDMNNQTWEREYATVCY